MLNTLVNSQQWPEGPIAGTALISLHELSHKFQFVDQKVIDHEAKRMITETETSESSRFAALSVAGERQLVNLGILQEIQEIALSDHEAVQIRMSAFCYTLVSLSQDIHQTKKN